MADCLNAMTVGVHHERAVVVSVIVGPQPGPTIVVPAGGQRRSVKGVDRCAVGSAEAEVRAGNWHRHLGFLGDGEFDTGRARPCAIVGAAALTEVDDACKSPSGRSTAS
jgi:hypothetical protein